MLSKTISSLISPNDVDKYFGLLGLGTDNMLSVV